MCGIVGYLGVKDAAPILLKGLNRLEYRGYDSAGFCIHTSDDFWLHKKQGRVADLETAMKGNERLGTLGIAHTRWATHGEPSDQNSHPHLSNNKEIAVVHNGIIENYQALKEFLTKHGYVFASQTDTEIVANLIEYIQSTKKLSFVEAVKAALTEIKGAYGLAVVHKDEPDILVVARNSSPIAIGIGKEEFVVASDVAAVLEHTKRVMYLEDGDVAVLCRNGTYTVTDIQENTRALEVHELDLDITEIEKGEFDHFMLKEIFEQPRAIEDSIRGRIDLDRGGVMLGGIQNFENHLIHARRIIFVACGTSWHAALTGEYFIEQLAGIPVEVEYASEFRYRKPIIDTRDVVIGISQSGETADTIGALEYAKAQGATVLGVCNVVGSTLSRVTDAGIYTHAGPEISVASTKAFTTQLTVLLLLAVRLSELRDMGSPEERKKLLAALIQIPVDIKKILQEKQKVQETAHTIAKASDIFFLGRGVGFPAALEGALKLKEISYIHAEGYPAGEMKHGPLALIEEGTPVIFNGASTMYREKLESSSEEIRARGAQVIEIAFESNKDSAFHIPDTHELLTPFGTTVLLQLLAYYVAIERGCDVDKPRNLAKSVTVE